LAGRHRRAGSVVPLDRQVLERMCFRNLLATPGERVFFKDLESRFLLVSDSFLLDQAHSCSMDDVIGKSDFDFFSDEHALAAFEDEQRIIHTGEPIVAKIERETFRDRRDAWVSTTKLPLRDDEGRIVGTFGVSRDVTAQVLAGGLIGAIDSSVLDEACRQLAQWMSEGQYSESFTVAVNLSGRQLSDPTLVERVASSIKRHGIVPSQLCLEVTETALIGELGDAAATLVALSELGVLLALDDFGTGYSTLAHVQRLNVGILKIDRSFVEQIGGSDRDREIIGAITAMAHALGMLVVGEGIETDRQLGELTALGCDEGQGFLLARPIPPDQVPMFNRGTGTPAGAGHWRAVSTGH
jgi:PAS domain S-box-containing protein